MLFQLSDQSSFFWPRPEQLRINRVHLFDNFWPEPLLSYFAARRFGDSTLKPVRQAESLSIFVIDKRYRLDLVKSALPSIVGLDLSVC